MIQRPRLPARFEYRTKRLVIRALRADDYGAWLECYSNILAAKNRWDFRPLDPEKRSRTSFREMLAGQRSAAKTGEGFHFAVFEKKSGEMVGLTLLQHIVVSRIANSAEIGWALNNRFWGKGYGTEMAEGTAQIAFRHLGVWRLEAAIARRNVRSIAVAKKLGFRRIGLSLGHFLIGEDPRNMVLYSRTRIPQ